MTKSQIESTVKYLIEKYDLSCLITDVKDRDFSTLIQNTKPGKLLNLCGKISLMEMVFLLQNTTLTISTDSGSMHISCALKKPTVGIFSSDLPERWIPSEYCNPVSIHADCAPCTIDKNTCPNHWKCINTIPFEMITSKIDFIMQHATF